MPGRKRGRSDKASTEDSQGIAEGTRTVARDVNMPEEHELTLADLRKVLEAQALEIQRLKQGPFVPLKRPAQPYRERYQPPEALQARARQTLPVGVSAGGTERWLDTEAGRRGIPPQYKPAFVPGDLVRIDPQAHPWGDANRLWGDILGDNPGIGEVLGCMTMTDTWEPKYKVVIRGLGPSDGMGLRESELLPLEG